MYPSTYFRSGNSENRGDMAVTFKVVFITAFAGILWLGCGTPQLAPEEYFPVRGTLQVTTIDTSGTPVSVPVTFKVSTEFNGPGNLESYTDSLILETNQQGMVEFSRDFRLRTGESVEIVADVSSSRFQSLTYWTVYYLHSDAPAKQVAVKLVIIPQ